MKNVAPMDYAIELAALTDVGTTRDHNEDACAAHAIDDARAVLVVADGVSLAEAGELASQMAVEVTLRSFAEQNGNVGHAKKLARAVQQANIEIHDKAMIVPELRGMATTLLAVSVEQGEVAAAHVGDSRLYLVRGSSITQLTKDHTLAAERSRLGLMSDERARNHPTRSVLTRAVGRELIVGVDRLTVAMQQGDAIVLCSDGLYNTLSDPTIAALIADASPSDACARLIAEANRHGTDDNLSVVVARMVGASPERAAPPGLGHRLRNLFR